MKKKAESIDIIIIICRQQAAGRHKPYDVNKQPRERTHENEKRIKRIVVVVVVVFF